MSASACLVAGEPTTAANVPTVVAVLRAHLQTLRNVVAALPPRVYQSTPSSASGSVGAQVRHCLDHVRAVVDACDSDAFSYDSRLRGTVIETDPVAAVHELDRLAASLNSITSDSLDRPVELTMQATRQTEVRLQTTVGREIAFVVQHTIHHSAIVRMLIERAGYGADDELGYAPSTLSRR